MKSVIIKIIPYLVLFVILNVICYHYSDFYKQEHKYVQRIDDTIDNQSETIFLGDSHVETIKLLNLSDNVGNLAFGADGVYEMYIKVLIMLEKNKNLKQVFIATEPQMFNNTGSSNSTFLGRYLLKIDDSLNVYNKSKLNLLTDRVPLFNDGYIGFALNSLYENFKTSTSQKEKLWYSLTDNQRKEIAVATGISDHRNLMGNESFLEAYRALVSLCKQNNIKIIGVRFPVNENYINQCAEHDLKRVNNFLDALNLDAYLDYSTRISNPKYFADEDHLNKQGVAQLAQIIYKDTKIKITK
ncbi:hypothetical protein J4050_09125 [Winogradskyella sp. DF17]|uniref:SGNH/GDSL hydrolase family protein n=1 Tax=Winogradskyella pelagia TaxID=2819984 RepID=A0ABS3T2D1_9FLAO|nr:hypothetical protein [Winogradskyella sp. DF17]MBO3116908.1 hypothetical protein [Winogradskyella sp. DF17]